MVYYIETMYPQTVLKNVVQFIDDKQGAMVKLKNSCYSQRDNLNTAFVRLVERKELVDSVVVALLVHEGKITQVYGRGNVPK